MNKNHLNRLNLQIKKL